MLIRRQLEGTLERRMGGIVDRPDQAGNVVRRRRLAPPLLDRSARVASEAGNKDIVLDDQHSCEMEVAVVPDIEAIYACRQQRLQPIAPGRLSSEQLIGQQAIGLAEAIPALLQGIEDVLGTRGDL